MARYLRRSQGLGYYGRRHAEDCITPVPGTPETIRLGHVSPVGKCIDGVLYWSHPTLSGLVCFSDCADSGNFCDWIPAKNHFDCILGREFNTGSVGHITGRTKHTEDKPPARQQEVQAGAASGAILTRGATGAQVTSVQAALNIIAQAVACGAQPPACPPGGLTTAWPCTVPPDPTVGPRTLTQVRSFQTWATNQGMDTGGTQGAVGPLTRAALANPPAVACSTPPVPGGMVVSESPPVPPSPPAPGAGGGPGAWVPGGGGSGRVTAARRPVTPRRPSTGARTGPPSSQGPAAVWKDHKWLIIGGGVAVVGLGLFLGLSD